MIKGTKKIIRDRTILHLNRFTADAGDFVTVVEESGVRKSTLSSILGLNNQSSSGQFYLFNQGAKHLTGREKRLIKRNALSLLFQDFGLIEYEIADFNLDTGLRFSNLSVSDKRTTKYEALKRVSINKKLGTSIYVLSSGEKQRIACVRALLENSGIILADEPTGSSDRRDREQVAEILSQQAPQGMLVIVVIHDPYLTKIRSKKIIL